MKEVVVVQYGRRNDFVAAKTFQKSDLLRRLITTYWINQKDQRLGPIDQVVRRVWPGSALYRSGDISDSKVSTHRLPALAGQVALDLRRNIQDGNFEFPWPITMFNRRAARELRDFEGVVYSLSDSQGLFARLPRATKVHEQVNCARAYYNALTEVERLDAGRKKRFQRGLDAEAEWMEHADYFVAPSEWIADNLKGYGVEASRIFVVPYWVPDWSFNSWRPRSLDAGEPLRLLFVGRIHPIKGAPALIEAVRGVGAHVELTLVGQNFIDWDSRSLPANVHVVSHVQRDKLLDIYHRAHIFVLPSLCEGSALVGYEAMGSGLPGIVTYQTGSRYVDRVSGRILQSGNADQIKAAVQEVLDNRDLVRKWSTATRPLAESLLFENYEKGLLRAMDSVMGPLQ